MRVVSSWSEVQGLEEKYYTSMREVFVLIGAARKWRLFIDVRLET